jgi:ribosomal protein S27E
VTSPSPPDAASAAAAAAEPTLQARGKFACPACGGEAQWDPRRQSLVCGYCGTVSPHQLTEEGEILEHDLVTALRAVPEQDRGWSGERRQVRCQHCHAISLFSAAQQGRACDFCGATALVPFDEGTEVVRPQSLLPYDAGYLSGWTVERYALDLKGAAEQGRQRMLQSLEQLCARDIRADTHRNLRMDARFEGQTFKHVLLPVWLVVYRYGTKDFQALVNGHSGRVAGEYPKSWVKITLAALLVLFVLIVMAQFEG